MGVIADVRSTSDATLVTRALHDDGDAFAELYRRHVRQILQFHHRRCADPNDAFDMTSETFAAALTSLDRFDPERSDFVGWLHGIARNMWRRYLRVGELDSRSRARLQMTEVTVTEDDLGHIDDLVDAAAYAESLSPRLDHLTDRLRVVIQLRVLDGLETAEVARRLGLSEATVRKRLQRALEQLAEPNDRFGTEVVR